MSVKKKKIESVQERVEVKEIESPKIYKALKSTKITCNGVFDLVEGEVIPKGIADAFIQSLISSNLIK